MSKTKSIVYAAVSGIGDTHRPTDFLYPSLQELFEEMEKAGLIEDYIILTKTEIDGVDEEGEYKEYTVGRMHPSESVRQDLHFLLLGNTELEMKVLRAVENYENAMTRKSRDGASVFENDFLCWFDLGACLGKAITSKDCLPRIESEVLASRKFTRSLEDKTIYYCSTPSYKMAVKFIS